MPTIIRIKESNLEIKKTSFFTNISVNTLWVEKGIAVVDVIANFNLAIANEAEARDAAITAEAQVRIDEDQALAQQITALNSSFNTNIASIETELSTLSTNVGAVASRTTTLEVTTEEHSARLVTSENAMAGIFTYWDGVSPVKASQLKIEGELTYQYTGSMWVPFNDTALGTANQVKGWVASSSSLIVDPITKQVTGWQYGDGSGFDSVFEISADRINLTGSTTFSEYAKITYVDDEVGDALALAQTALDTADGKIVTFYQNSAPSSASEGDIWFDTDDGNKIYTYRSSNWVVTQDTKIAEAITSAQTAQTTADGKAIVYYQNDAPTGLVTDDKGDIWIDTNDNNRLYIWSGSAWVVGLTDLAKADMSNVTTIDGGKITTGIIYNAGGTSTTYTMKIDLNAGEIHIR